jgi:hypothetical protein
MVDVDNRKIFMKEYYLSLLWYKDIGDFSRFQDIFF